MDKSGGDGVEDTFGMGWCIGIIWIRSTGDLKDWRIETLGGIYGAVKVV